VVDGTSLCCGDAYSSGAAAVHRPDHCTLHLRGTAGTRPSRYTPTTFMRGATTRATIRVLLIGVGPHARRFYLPSLAALARTQPVAVAAAVELDGLGPSAKHATSEAGFPNAMILEVAPFEGPMPEQTVRRLDAVCRDAEIDVVIVATEPMAHVGYALWAIERRLPLLLDKPLSARRDSVSDPMAAAGIAGDFDALAEAYRKSYLRDGTPPIVSVCAHRRFHPGIAFVCEQIGEVSHRTGCPVTSIHCHHSDGQWRLPAEMLTQEHHSYHHGHGKASHSGHHFLDCAWLFWRSGSAASGKHANNVRVFASMITAESHVQHLSRKDYLRLFGERYAEFCPHGDTDLRNALHRCGEIDVSAVATFCNDDTPLANASFDLQHTGFSRRSWVAPPADLYKGNGRVKHEHHRVHIGPFRAIHVHSYQAVDEHDTADANDLLPGGRNHYDITIFTNTAMLGGSEAVKHVQLTDVAALEGGRLHIEQIKDGVVAEFLKVVRGELAQGSMQSELLDHEVPTRMLSALYRSHVARRAGQNPIISFPLSPI
jgi:predicted dehydrogenase